MLLSKKDVNQIKKLGYKFDDFALIKDGWIQLKNQNDVCVFHDGKKCKIYNFRPEGCRLYPIVYDYDAKKAFLDKDCPMKQNFKITNERENQLHT